MESAPQDPRLALRAAASSSVPPPPAPEPQRPPTPGHDQQETDAVTVESSPPPAAAATAAAVDATDAADVETAAPSLFMPASPEVAEPDAAAPDTSAPDAAAPDGAASSIADESMLVEQSTLETDAPYEPTTVEFSLETPPNEPADEAVSTGPDLEKVVTSSSAEPTPTRSERLLSNDAGVPVPLPTKPKRAPARIAKSPPVEEKAPARKAAQSRVSALRQTVERDPRNGSVWLELIVEVEKKGDLDKTREMYDAFLEHFPDAAPQWVNYAKLELEHGNFAEVEKIFSRCLRNSVSVELWAFYLNYIRRINPIEGENASRSRSLITQAYDFSLNHVGVDREAGVIWTDYIGLVKSGEAAGTWQEQQKMDQLRKIYRRAVSVPLENVEQIWRDYDHFENQINKMTAKKFLGERSPQYMTARSALRELKKLSNRLYKPRVPVQPTWQSPMDQNHVEAWKAYLAWENSNPLDLDDPAALQARQQHAHKQAIMHMRFFPEIWLLSGITLDKAGKSDDALIQLRSGLAANPASLVLAFAVADQEEQRSNTAECYKTYDALVAQFQSEIDDANKAMSEATATALEALGAPPVKRENEAEEEISEEEQRRVREEEDLKERVGAAWAPRIDGLKLNLSHVWITEIRFAYRAEGIKAARGVFAKARASTHKTYLVFEASAMMEYHQNKAVDVAKNIFKLGLGPFGEDVPYILAYLNFLLSLNDESNARALFEKTVSKLSPQVAKPLWDRWAAYEYEYGDAAAIQKLDGRLAELFPDTSPTDRFVQRHLVFGDASILDRDLGRHLTTPSLGSNAQLRSPSPVPVHLQGLNRVNGNGPAVPPPRNRVRERSFSPDGGRGKRPRAAYRERSPDRRGRLPPQPPMPPRGGRFDSPPPREDPYGWFPEGVRFFLGVLPMAHTFDGPKLETKTVMQVLADADLSKATRNRVPPPGPSAGAGWGRGPMMGRGPLRR